MILISTVARAGIVLTGTRVIYPTDKKEVTVTLKNTANHPLLVQSWVDAGDSFVMPEKINVPFLIIPPITRIDSGKGNTLRIIFTGGVFPADRESVFWLNVLAVPPKKDGGDDQFLNVAYQTRIKLFLRPAGLKENVKLVAKKLKWIREGTNLTVHNPSPYYISFASASMGTRHDLASFEGRMIPPFGTMSSPEDIKVLSNSHEIHYSIIDDMGSVIETRSQLQ